MQQPVLAADPLAVPHRLVSGLFLGRGLLEVSGRGPGPSGVPVMIWRQVRDVRAGHRRVAAAGMPIG
jgi:hypothetical protein